jgi:putative hydrolase of the HAD superfamily
LRRLSARAVLFDLDNTLWSRDDAVRRLATTQHSAFAELAVVPVAQYAQRVIALDDRGRVDKSVVYQQIVRDFDLPDALAVALYDHFWTMYATFCEPVPDAVAVLTALRAAGFKTGIVTNGTVAIQDPKIAGLGLAPFMDVILVSEREGIRKPDSAIFHRAVTRSGVEPSEAWFVGDHPDADVRGAAEAGLTAVWLRSWADAAPYAAHTISALSELLPLLQGTKV